MNIKFAVFVILGCICLGLGTIGVFLPILPSVPFYLLTAFFFANSSKRLHEWFIRTKLYRKHLESYVRRDGMPMKTKAGIIVAVTVLIGFGFFMMARKGVWLPCIILAVVWLCHVVYFTFFVKTLPPSGK